jgi:hypothetical protein
MVHATCKGIRPREKDGSRTLHRALDTQSESITTPVFHGRRLDRIRCDLRLWIGAGRGMWA